MSLKVMTKHYETLHVYVYNDFQELETNLAALLWFIS